LYAGIVSVFLIALPTLFLPPKFTLLFGKFLGHYVIFIVRIFLNTRTVQDSHSSMHCNSKLN